LYLIRRFNLPQSRKDAKLYLFSQKSLRLGAFAVRKSVLKRHQSSNRLKNLKYKIMKKIEAIIRVSKFQQVKDALHEIDIDFFTYWDTVGVGNEKKRKGSYRGIDTEFIARRTLSIVVRDINLKKTIDCLLKVAYTGEVGDGKIFVSNIEESYRIRTKEAGDESLFIKD